MLSEDQRDEFARTGLLRLTGVLDEPDAARVRADIWAFLAQEYGVEQADRDTWPAVRIPKFKGLRRSDSFGKVGVGHVPAALDALMPGWKAPKAWAGAPMVTFPMPDETWDVPNAGWHFDTPFVPDDKSAAPGINVFVFADTVRPRGAGTVVLSGSHHLVASYADAHQAMFGGLQHARELRAALSSDHACLRDLWNRDDRSDRIQRFMVEGTEIDGVRLRVVELTGEPGEAVLMDARTLHTIGSNCLDRPRLMLNQLISR